jgi:conjugative transfer region protein TrbK
MNPKIIARTAAVVVLAGAVLACALEFAQRNRTPAPSTATAHDNMDPLADEPSRCKAIGAETAKTPHARVAWSQNSARFLARSAPYPDRSIELFPATSDTPQGVPRFIGTDCHQTRNPMAAN